jgi:hypothetical protein
MASAAIASEHEELSLGDVVDLALPCDFSGWQNGELDDVLGFVLDLLVLDTVFQETGVAAV